MKIFKKIGFVLALLLIIHFLGWFFVYVTHDQETDRIVWGVPFPHTVFVPAWERKVDLIGTAPLKVGMITDTQVKSVGVTKGDFKNRYLKEQYHIAAGDFVAHMQSFDPAFSVHLGDVIEGSDADEIEARTNIDLLAALLDDLEAPFYWVHGNHDTRSLTRDQFAQQLGIDYIQKTFDVGPYRFVIVDFNFRDDTTPNSPENGDYIPGFAPTVSLQWLEEQLDTTQQTIILAHHPVVPKEYIDKNTVRNNADVRALAEKYNVFAAFHGHVELRHASTINGVQYFLLPGTKKNPFYPAAHYTLTLDQGAIHLDMHYRDPKTGEMVSEPFIVEEKMIDFSESVKE